MENKISNYGENNIKAKIEAALYAAGRPLSKFELSKAAGITSHKKSLAIARELMYDVNSTFNAIQMFELDSDRFVIQIKPEYTTSARKFSSRPLLSQAELKTLSYIVHFQPITGKELAERRGPTSYPHLRALRKLGFIKFEPHGRTKLFHTTNRLAEYFGLPNDPSVLKTQLIKSGLKLKKSNIK